jgi:hypothetical protein
MDYYQKLIEAGCKVDNHESDLYAEATPLAIEITKDAQSRSFFRSEVDGKQWLEIPFAYTPWWAARSK